MIEFNNYSEFCLWLEEHDDEWECVVGYDDWSVVRIGSRYYYYEHEVEGDSDEFHQVIPVARLHYSMMHDIKTDKYLYELFDNDMCGEQVTDNEIIYWWFKEVEEE